jgi:hypothetical protein
MEGGGHSRMYVEQPKRIRRMRRKKEKRNGKTREASQQESSVEKNPRGRVLAGTVYSSSCGNFFWFLVFWWFWWF